MIPPRFRKRPLAWALTVLPAMAVVSCAPADRNDNSLAELLPRTPGINVLVVSFDALRADRLGVHGYPRRTSPHIDRFAADALVFDRAWSAAQATPSSFAAVFTGQYPTRVFHGWRLVAEPTLAEAFSRAGYETAFFSSNVQLVAGRRFDRGFERYDLVPGDATTDPDRDGIAEDRFLLERASAWLRARSSRPFFAWVHFISPHSPYVRRPTAAHLYDAEYRGRFRETTGHSFEVESEAELARVRDLYDGQVFHADTIFQELIDEVAGLGLLEDTVVVLTSDHGEELMEHGRLQHDSVHEEVIRVPLVIRHPRGARGLRSGLPVSSVDLYPTLAAIAGAAVVGDVDGRSLREPVPLPRLRLAMAVTHAEDQYVAAILGQEKVILDCRAKSGSLFDLADDPGETRDLRNERPKRYREIVAAATEELGAEPCSAIGEAVRQSRPEEGLDAATRRRLEALGYLDDRGAGHQGDERRFWADPNPIPVCDGLLLGQTSLRWELSDPGDFEIRVGSTGGKLMARVGVAGSAPTGRWVTDGMEFFLVNRDGGQVLGQTRVSLTSEGCPGHDGAAGN